MKQQHVTSNSNLWASWSITLGIMGIVSSLLCCIILDLPAGIFLGIFGIAMAFQSRELKTFSPQAKLGLVLSITALIISLMIYGMILYSFHVLSTNPDMARLMSQFYRDMKNISYQDAYENLIRGIQEMVPHLLP